MPKNDLMSVNDDGEQIISVAFKLYFEFNWIVWNKLAELSNGFIAILLFWVWPISWENKNFLTVN